MPVPTHGPSCQTLTRPIHCPSCKQKVFWFTCSCRSSVLLDKPWGEVHDCSSASGIGGSGLRGWEAVDQMRSTGLAITDEVMKAIFPNESPKNESAKTYIDMKKVSPRTGEDKYELAIVRDIHASTRRASEANALPEMARKLLGLESNLNYGQVTFVINDVSDKRSYTALVPESLMPKLKLNTAVGVRLSGRVGGRFAQWVVAEVHLL